MRLNVCSKVSNCTTACPTVLCLHTWGSAHNLMRLTVNGKSAWSDVICGFVIPSASFSRTLDSSD
jgi:hypothetical protein